MWMREYGRVKFAESEVARFMKLLITGGGGFIGPHVGDLAALLGHEVFLTDIRTIDSSHEFRQADLLSVDELVSISQDLDAICHLGGVGDVYLAAENPALAAQGNVVGTVNVLEAARINQLQKVVFASTWEVYGKPEFQPIDEDHPCNPEHPYNITKLAAERLAMAYDKLHGVPVVGLRLGTAYGLNMRANSVFSLFITKALKGDPITVTGTGKQTRQFTHVTDIARAFVRAVERKVHGEVINIVAEEPISIRQLAEMVSAELPTTIEYMDPRPGDVVPALLTSEKARVLLDWTPKVAFRDGLRDLIQAFIDEFEIRQRE